MRSIFVLLVAASALHAADVAIKNEKCKHCQFLVETFQAGLKRTARQHFGGGDTAWEEKNLGKYATSETRLVETMEGVCKKKTLSNTDKYNGLSELEFKCSALLEEHEELLEEYYGNHQEANMEAWLCIQQLKLCCPDGHFGPECSACPAVETGAKACFGRGQCHGDGSRKGSGKCKCDVGYMGNMCRHCDAEYFEVSKTDTTVECQKCFEGCLGGCSGAGAIGCSKCRSGWLLKEGEGCADVDECAAEQSPCTGENEHCVNTVGSFNCECNDGFKKENGLCVVDFEASPQTSWRPDLFLRFIAMSSLVAIITLVVWHRSILLMFLTAIAVVLVLVIEVNVNPGSIPDEAKKMLAF